MTRNVGAGSRSQLLAAEALMILDISSGRQISNESRLLSVRVKTGGGADAVADWWLDGLPDLPAHIREETLDLANLFSSS